MRELLEDTVKPVLSQLDKQAKEMKEYRKQRYKDDKAMVELSERIGETETTVKSYQSVPDSIERIDRHAKDMELNLVEKISNIHNSLNIVTSKFSNFEREIESLKQTIHLQDDQLTTFRSYSETLKEVLNASQTDFKSQIEQRLFQLRNDYYGMNQVVYQCNANVEFLKKEFDKYNLKVKSQNFEPKIKRLNADMKTLEQMKFDKNEFNKFSNQIKRDLQNLKFTTQNQENTFKSICNSTFTEKFEKMMNDLQKKKLSKDAKSAILGEGRRSKKMKFQKLKQKMTNIRKSRESSTSVIKNKRLLENRESNTSLIWRNINSPNPDSEGSFNEAKATKIANLKISTEKEKNPNNPPVSKFSNSRLQMKKEETKQSKKYTVKVNPKDSESGENENPSSSDSPLKAEPRSAVVLNAKQRRTRFKSENVLEEELNIDSLLTPQAPKNIPNQSQNSQNSEGRRRSAAPKMFQFSNPEKLAKASKKKSTRRKSKLTILPRKSSNGDSNQNLLKNPEVDEILDDFEDIDEIGMEDFDAEVLQKFEIYDQITSNFEKIVQTQVNSLTTQIKEEMRETKLKFAKSENKFEKLFETVRMRMDEDAKNRKRDMIDAKLIVDQINLKMKDNMATITSSCVNKIKVLQEQTQKIWQDLQLQVLVEKQEIEDRQKMGLFGVQEDVGVIRKQVVDRNTYPVTVDKECFSCTKGSTVMKAFKMACISYQPSKIMVDGERFSRQEILQKRREILNKISTTPNKDLVIKMTSLFEPKPSSQPKTAKKDRKVIFSSERENKSPPIHFQSQSPSNLPTLKSPKMPIFSQKQAKIGRNSHFKSLDARDPNPPNTRKRNLAQKMTKELSFL